MPKLDAAQLLANVVSTELPRRHRAKTVLGSLTPDADIDVAGLITGLKSPDEDVVFWTGIALERLHERSAAAIPLLIPLLQHQSLAVRQTVVDTLAAIGRRDATARAAVFGAFKHPDPDVRSQALSACIYLPGHTPAELAAIAAMAADPDPRVADDTEMVLRNIRVRSQPPVEAPAAAEADSSEDEESGVDKFALELARCVRARKPFQNGMRQMVRWCARHNPHPDWKKVAALDLAADERTARSGLADILRKETIPFPVRGLFFHLAEMGDARGREFIELSLAFTGQYDPADEQLLWALGDLRHDPARPVLRARAVKAAGAIFNRDSGKGLGGDAFYRYGLAYSALLATSLLTPALHKQFGAPSKPIGLLAGWSDGDCLRPGEFKRTGFAPRRGAMM